ncbi:hypothetical protein BJV74DRAFT_202392 [Russula compacta]|nr:hypothetical protein BJV74DRAFT_202392 [Russula compacta]
MNHPRSLLVDGYISQSFTPRVAERYFFSLLKNNIISLCSPSYIPGRESAFFLVPSVPPHIMSQFAGQPSWVIDHGVVYKGTIVPQTLWVPQTGTDRRHHVDEAELQLPIFFEGLDGRLGLSLEAAAQGRCQGLLNAQSFAPLGLKSTTHIRIMWPGYVDFKRQVQIRDETGHHNPITISRFAHHIGRSVVAFLRNCQPDPGCTHPRHSAWGIGAGGIQGSDIIIIGAVHVSAGSWMPILQLNRYVL